VTTALATQTPFTPTGIEQATQLAMTLAKSTLIPSHLQGKPADILVTIITGHELGLSPMQSLRGMHVINGKASMSADLMVALVLKHRDICEYFRLVESTDTSAIYETRRLGSEPVKLAWTMAQAHAAGLSSGPTWKKHPAAMLRARCATALARAVYPDLVLGVYDPEEAAEFSSPVRSVPPPANVVEMAPPPPPPAGALEPGIDPVAMQPPVLTPEVVQPEPVDTSRPDADIRSRIAACTSLGTLVLLLNDIKRLPPPLNEEVLDAYRARREALKVSK
jgi:hypothetical protein